MKAEKTEQNKTKLDVPASQPTECSALYSCLTRIYFYTSAKLVFSPLVYAILGALLVFKPIVSPLLEVPIAEAPLDYLMAVPGIRPPAHPQQVSELVCIQQQTFVRFIS